MSNKKDFSNPYVERVLLSLCMKSFDCFLEASAGVDETDFLCDPHPELFSILKGAAAGGAKEFDIHTIISKAESRNILKEVGGFKYIAAIKEMLVSEENLQVHIKELLDRSYKYKLYNTLDGLKTKVERSSNDEENTFTSLAGEVEKRVVDLSVDISRTDDAVLLSSGLEDRLEEFKERQDFVIGIRSGIPLLDRCTRGFCGGALYVLCARPKAAKSATLMNFALRATTEDKLSILYLDTEMSQGEIGTRALSCLSGVPEDYIISGKYAENDELLTRTMDAMDILDSCKYFHKYTPRFNVEEIRRLAKKYKVKEDIDMLFFDYIKANEFSRDINETQYLGLLASTLKDIAGELNIPVITAAQLSRAADKKTFVSSTMVGESDRILRYCNSLLALAWKKPDEIKTGGGINGTGTHRLQILENRSGRVLQNGIDLSFTPHILRMEQAKLQSAEAVSEQKEFAEHKDVFGF